MNNNNDNTSCSRGKGRKTKSHKTRIENSDFKRPEVTGSTLNYREEGPFIITNNKLGLNDKICLIEEPGFELEKLSDNVFTQRRKKDISLTNQLNNTTLSSPETEKMLLILNINAKDFFNKKIDWIRNAKNKFLKTLRFNKNVDTKDTMMVEIDNKNKISKFKTEYARLIKSASFTRKQYEKDKIKILIEGGEIPVQGRQRKNSNSCKKNSKDKTILYGENIEDDFFEDDEDHDEFNKKKYKKKNYDDSDSEEEELVDELMEYFD